MKLGKPEIGTKMYAVHEHLYYIPDNPGPILEYCVCEGNVEGFYHGGYTEIKLSGPSPDGYRTPYWYKLSDVGKRVFYTVEEAAALAQNKTEEYEQTWRWLGPPHIPLRRTWEKYLD